ncbi:MAG: glutamate synthase (NADPH/NADH) small chain [Rhodospirillaceae bacterium]|nr:MAG: glutamate synthase (NADPH/NADH) small chain [Rhodospirillaceae bacterium]
MAGKLLHFVHLPQQMPDKRPAVARRTDFDEIYTGFSVERAASQASRCEQCGIPFCQIGCPLGNNIPDWLMLIAGGRREEAYALAAATNDFPEITGRICPQDRLCEGACVLEQAHHEAVTIGAVERFITDTAFAEGWVRPERPASERPTSVGIIGAGPAGLAAAGRLRARGYAVEVYDRHDRMGGLLIYGIPSFKLEKTIVSRRVELLQAAGVRFHAGCAVGHDVSLAELRCRHGAVLIATGVHQARPLEIPGSRLTGVWPALAYLVASTRKGLGDAVPAFDDGSLNAHGKRVVVIGGGDTSVDCVRTALRQGAVSVKCLYRRDRGNMPGSQREVANAIEEGAEFVWLAAPEVILSGEDGQKVAGVRAARMELGGSDASGRQESRPVEGSSFTEPADLVLTALGFEPEDLPVAFGEAGLGVTARGTLRVDPRTGMTTLEGVFAAGDIVRGASLVVWAIRDGREAAAAIHGYLEVQEAGRGKGNGHDDRP